MKTARSLSDMTDEEYDKECKDAEDKAIEDFEKKRESDWDEYETIHYGGLQ